MSNWVNIIQEQTKQFNLLAGNETKLTAEDMRNQFKYIFEEVKEIEEALDKDDAVKLVDGVIDSFVTLFGLASKLETLWVDMTRAARETCANNLSKFPVSEEVAYATANKLAREGDVCSVVYNPEFSRYAILDQNNKVRKPIGFVSNDLSGCVPAQKISELKC